MTPNKVKDEILKAINRNAARDHEASEFKYDLGIDQMQVDGALSELVSEGRVAQREWTGGITVFGLPDGFKAVHSA